MKGGRNLDEMTTAEYNKMLEQIAEIIRLKAKTPEEAAEIVLDAQVKA